MFSTQNFVVNFLVMWPLCHSLSDDHENTAVQLEVYRFDPD